MSQAPRAPLSERLADTWAELGGDPALAARLHLPEDHSLPSVFATSDLAVTSIGAAGLALAEWCAAHGMATPSLEVSRRLASYWFGLSFTPIGWEPPPLWDPFAGDYRGKDGWIRLHTNAPHHRAAALRVLGTHHESKRDLAEVVSGWEIEALESAVVEAGGCAATMRSAKAWRNHPTGKALAAEPLAIVEHLGSATGQIGHFAAERPLAGVRVLDLTRILAGPIATRFFAGYGADVLRVDPPHWDEGVTIPEVTLGKRCARLDLQSSEGRARFLDLLSEADVLVHGYRSDALERLGLGAETRRAAAPALVDVSLDAYGWNTPWAGRRGFDSLVQMSCGIAEEGMRRLATETPKPLPVQALDHATGYFMAAAAIRGLTLRLQTGLGSRIRFSLARTANLLIGWGAGAFEQPLDPLSEADYAVTVEPMSWGHARRLKPPLTIPGVPMWWPNAARALGSDQPEWRAAH